MVSNLEQALKPKVNKSATKFQKKTAQFAASWYVAMKSRELGKKPKAIQLFGQSLVAWRDRQGKPTIMERFCSHMGASLAIGKVVEDCIQCPFHHWHFDSSGECVAIPEVAEPKVDHIPSSARQVIYVTEERYGYIWVWYGSATPLFSLPEFNAAESEKHNYMPYRFSCHLKTSVERMIENAFDHLHVVTTHGMSVSQPIELTLLSSKDIGEDELPIQQEAWFGSNINAYNQSFNDVSAFLKVLKLNFETFTTRVDAWPSGLIGIISTNGKQRYQVLTTIVPLANDEIVLQALVMINKTGNFLLDLIFYVIFGLVNKTIGMKDKPILDTIDADAGGAFIKTDRPVLKFREFYQSWVDKVE